MSKDAQPFNRSRDAALVVLVAAGYYVGTKIGFALTPGGQPIAVFWPPNAILLASLLLAPVRLWLPCLLALVPAHFLAQAQNGIPFATAFGWLIGNAGEAVLGATLICGWQRRRGIFRSVNGITRFLLFGFILAPLVTSFIDAATVVGTHLGRDYWLLWVMRLLSNMLAQLTIVPTIVEFGSRAVSRDPRSRRWSVEALALAAAVVLSSVFVFRSALTLGSHVPALIYVPLPLLLWAAMRFGPAGLGPALLTISVVSIHSVMHGRGPFISPSLADSVLSMQVFLCSIGAPLLVLAAVAMERQQTAQSLSETSRKLIDAQERERQRIGRELHDGLAQTLALAELELDRVIADHRHAPAVFALRSLRNRMTAISEGLWAISHGLYPWNLEYIGLVHALTRLCSEVADGGRLRVTCETSGVPRRLPGEVSLCLYRVAQEALQNIARHSEATVASISVRAPAGRLAMRIADDGVGFNPAIAASGLGLASMRERIAAVEGGIDIDSAPGRGTRIEVWVPLAAEVVDAQPAVGE